MTASTKRALQDGLIIGSMQAVILVVLLILVTVFFGNQQQETLDAIRSANENAAAAISCSLGSPATQSEVGGQTVTQRDEEFINRVCLTALGFDPIDLDGDGDIEGKGAP